MSERKPLIVIGVPCYGMVAPELLEDWMRWAFYCGRHLPQYDFNIGIVTKKEQFRARNAIVEEAQKVQADYLLMIDDDMIINTWQTVGVSEAYGFIETLIQHQKDICGVLYFQRQGGCHPILMQGHPEHKGYRFLREDEIQHRLQDVDVAGGGCLLINMRVFDKLPMPFFTPEYDYGTDVQICRAAKVKGFSVAADTSIELGHLREERTIITSRNRSLFAMNDALPGEVKRAYDSEAVYASLVDDACAFTGYRDMEELTAHAQVFMTRRHQSGLSDADWYRQFPKERVARQVWFNQSPQKRATTEFLISSLDHRKPLRILDFGCGIGIPAFFFAERGHQVTALDVAGTGTLQFLQWRAAQHGVSVAIRESQTELPEFAVEDEFDVIVAMDTIEHVSRWRELVPLLVSRLRDGGVLFSNNAILEDALHPEHYPINNREFIEVCLAAGLLPVNQVTYEKRTPVIARLTHQEKDLAHA